MKFPSAKLPTFCLDQVVKCRRKGSGRFGRDWDAMVRKQIYNEYLRGMAVLN
jgi:hypothetical protein